MSDPSSVSTPRPYLVVDSPYEVANWRPLVHWLLQIPHAVVVYALQAAARILFVVYWLIFLFTGKLNVGLYGMLALHERYNARTNGFLLGWSETYPPFDFDIGPSDNGAYPPITLTLPEPPETAPRTAAFNFILAIPHYLVLIVFGIGAVLTAIGGWFAVLFTGAWPSGWRDFLVRVSNYYYRVWTYVVMVENDYPKFGLPAR